MRAKLVVPRAQSERDFLNPSACYLIEEKDAPSILVTQDLNGSVSARHLATGEVFETVREVEIPPQIFGAAKLSIILEGQMQDMLARAEPV